MRNRSRGRLKYWLGENPLNRSAIHEMSRKARELTRGEDIVYSPNEISGNRGFKGMRRPYSSQPDRLNGMSGSRQLYLVVFHDFSSTRKTRRRPSARKPMDPASTDWQTTSSPINLTSRKNSWGPLIIKS